MDSVFIEGLCVDVVIGVHAWEKEITQPLWIDLEMKWDTKPAAKEDSYQHALCYDSVARAIESYLKQQTTDLIETVAEKVAYLVESEFGVQAVEVTVRKPTALTQAKAVGVRIKRGLW